MFVSWHLDGGRFLLFDWRSYLKDHFGHVLEKLHICMPAVVLTKYLVRMARNGALGIKYTFACQQWYSPSISSEWLAMVHWESSTLLHASSGTHQVSRQNGSRWCIGNQVHFCMPAVVLTKYLVRMARDGALGIKYTFACQQWYSPTISSEWLAMVHWESSTLLPIEIFAQKVVCRVKLNVACFCGAPLLLFFN